MSKSKNRTSRRSKCCNAKVKVVGSVTLYAVCTKCHEACDTFIVERKTWEINPRTRVVPNKKNRDNKSKIERDLGREYGC